MAPRKASHVTIRHIVNSIYQIELWCDAVRQLLECLPPEMCVPVCDIKTGKDWKLGQPIRKVSGCPPPQDIKKVVGCPPPTDARIKVVGCPPPRRNPARRHPRA